MPPSRLLLFCALAAGTDAGTLEQDIDGLAEMLVGMGDVVADSELDALPATSADIEKEREDEENCRAMSQRYGTEAVESWPSESQARWLSLNCERSEQQHLQICTEWVTQYEMKLGGFRDWGAMPASIIPAWTKMRCDSLLAKANPNPNTPAAKTPSTPPAAATTTATTQLQQNSKTKPEVHVQKVYNWWKVPGRRYKLSVEAIFKNEAHILKEWLDHHIRQGVEHFYLIDNGSDDNFKSVLQPYMAQGVVELHTRPAKHLQNHHYQSLLPKINSETDWLLITDLDEFTYANPANPKGKASMVQYLESLPTDVSQVLVTWRQFGSGGHLDQPASVLKSFTQRASTKSIWTHKVIVRPERVASMRIHTMDLKSGLTVIPTIPPKKVTITLGQPHPMGGAVFGNFDSMDDGQMQQMAIKMNHYQLQSLNWYKRVKLTRGDVLEQKMKHSMGYFEYWDRISKIPDYELMQITMSAGA